MKDLSTPRGVRQSTAYDPDTFGRLSERLARFLGTGRYLAIQTIFVAVWILLNGFLWYGVFRGKPPDQYPFILLNLMFSTQAAYAAPLILLAQNRQADRDRIEYERDREVNTRAVADTEFLAREIAGLRIALERKVDRDDLEDAVTRLTEVLETYVGSVEETRGGGQYDLLAEKHTLLDGSP
jgi:uncharacterized membrane protein